MQIKPTSVVGLAVLCLLAACSSDPPKAGSGADGGPGGGGGNDDGSGSNGNNGVKGSPQDHAGLPNFVPTFPGAGTGNASDPLVGGMLCDYVARAGEKGAEPVTQCFFGAGQTTPAATLEQVLECVDGKDSVHLRLTFDPSFVDNTYGEGAIGWPARGGGKKKMMMGMDMMAPVEDGKHHSFEDLVGSDHAELKLTNGEGTVVSHFKLDYISADASAPSGYASLGVTGGEGKVIVGDAADIVEWSTSFDENLNERGYGSYTVDSPLTDEKYTPNPAAPEWDYRVVYEVWVDIAAFDGKEFGDAFIEFVHASPSKADTNTIEVTPGPCPPCKDPYACWDVPPPVQIDGGVVDAGCVTDSPDDDHCYDGGVTPPSPPPEGQWCIDHPELPECIVD